MFDMEAIEDMSVELSNADKAIRKALALPDDMANPSQVVVALTGLARAAIVAANAVALLQSNARDRQLLEEELRAKTA